MKIPLERDNSRDHAQPVTGDIKTDFRTFIVDHPCRCSKCHHMQNRGALMVWVLDSEQWFNNPYEDLAKFAKMGNGHYSAWCESCVERSKPSFIPAAVKRFWGLF